MKTFDYVRLGIIQVSLLQQSSEEDPIYKAILEDDFQSKIHSSMSLTKLRCIHYILKKKKQKNKLKPAATSLYGLCPESQRNAKKCGIILGS